MVLHKSVQKEEEKLALKFDFNEFKEIIVVGAVMVGILLPARMIFLTLVSDSWIGSFGLMSAVAVTILYLAKKDKLGKFGRMFTRQMFKIHKGKRRYFIYPNLAFAIMFLSMVIIGIEQGDTTYTEKKAEFKELIPDEQQNMEAVMEQTKDIKPIDFILAIFAIFYLLFFRFDIFSVMISTLNDISGSFISHFSTIMLIEQLEFAGILIYYKLGIKKTHNF